jgi:hypothetical protein
VANFVNRVNSKLHSQEQEERVRQISDRIGPFENVSAPPELTSVCILIFFSNKKKQIYICILF